MPTKANGNGPPAPPLMISFIADFGQKVGTDGHPPKICYLVTLKGTRARMLSPCPR
jgi:hypothetical protein